MAYLKKRGKYYYAKWHTTQNGYKISVRKSLGTRHKDVAQKMLRNLEKLESLGKVNPFTPGFNPVIELRQLQKPKQEYFKTLKEAVDNFYRAKSHLSPATLAAYKRAIDHFVEFNNLEKMDPRNVSITHFENIIFKPGIKSATRHYYFRHFRMFWRFLIKKGIVENDFFKILKQELPGIRENTRPKMISEEELKILFKAFDSDLVRKKQLLYHQDYPSLKNQR